MIKEPLLEKFTFAVLREKILRVYWLAEQGLSPKRALLVIIPLIIFLISEVITFLLQIRKDVTMNNTNNAIDVLNASLKAVSNLSGNIAGGALLANTLYTKKDRSTHATVFFRIFL